MKEYLKQGAVIAAFVFVAVFGALKLNASNPNLAGDFPGGIAPSQLFSANVAGGYVQPIGSFAIAGQNGMYVGGTNSYNEITNYVTASGTPASVVTLGPLNSTTSTATTSVTLSYVAGLSIGSICSGSSATNTVYVSGCLLNSTNGVTGTAVVAYSNITGANLSVPTSTRLNITFDQLPY